ncbi:uncharacterized protein GGS22DRAFT_197865 [Annulohypoxylon maeteangense]|uniref:uncharacterized protein n=1 Tax=Annulohypoxylon maeteangense TaxID=1927788 RepID=UPI002008C946|nr:uncharacterized protein GGS22DRAFT_197865 [Annulohypoxylon maeteangense]KAI0887948.1 hypothetical protein GGS22DRAFT_197865 [Annulohypoxylon maeteangense]
MPPQTRSRGKSSAGGSYRSTAAAPKQQLFPARRKHVKTYGRPRSAPKDPKQGTLTQMDFVSPSMPEDLLNSEEEVEDENEDVEEQEVPPPVEASKPKKRVRESRRKTAGDELATDEKPGNTKRRKTLGDVPPSNPSSSFHTQTLTQFLSVKGEDEPLINDSEGDDDADLIMETPTKPKEHASSEPHETMPEQQTGIKSSLPSLAQSVTPTNRPRRSIIPSSSTTIDTPGTTPIAPRFSMAQNSPLAGKSTNLNAPSPIIKKLSKTTKLDDRIIQDSYSTSHSSPATSVQSPTVKVTPRKQIRFKIPPEDKENFTPNRSEPKPPKPPRGNPGREPMKEIPDSQYDSDETHMEGEEVVRVHQNAPVNNVPDIDDTNDIDAAETCYGAIGDETQAEIDRIPGFDESDSLEESRSRSVTPTPKPRRKQKQILHTSQAASVPAIDSASTSIVKETPLSSPRPELPDENVANTHTQVYTQGLQSQRLTLETIRSLGPQTRTSDIMVSLHPEPLARILDRTKDHEFRSWNIPHTVCRVWLYSTKPLSELKYMCILTPPKTPGEIEDEKGIGNAEFNQGNQSAKFAYEILQVYELNNPVSLDEMKNKGWIAAAPQKFIWVPTAVVGELTANLKCALFGEEEQDAEDALVASYPNVTESQELNAQLQSDVDYSTQRHSPGNVNEAIPSTQSPIKSSGKKGQSGDIRDFAKPALPRLASGSSVRSQREPLGERSQGLARPSQATTVSSPGVSPEKSLPQAILIPSEATIHSIHSSSPTPYRNTRNNSLRSSQFLTRSQMLPDSLVNEEIQEPPPIIWDSEDEHSDS